MIETIIKISAGIAITAFLVVTPVLLNNSSDNSTQRINSLITKIENKLDRIDQSVDSICILRLNRTFIKQFGEFSDTITIDSIKIE